MFHEIEVIGRLGRDGEMRYTPNGKAVTNFSVATDDGYGDNKKTIWFKVSLWDKQAENLTQYLTKGQVVRIKGTLQTTDAGECRTWTDQYGKVHASFEINARDVRLLPGGPKREDGEAEQEKTAKVPF